MTRVWILTTDARVSGLLDAANGLAAAEVEAVVVGPRDVAGQVAVAEGPARVLLLETGATTPLQAATGALAALASRERPDLVVAGSTRDDKVLLAACAAGAGADVLTSVSAVRPAGDGIAIDRTLLGTTVAETSVWAVPIAVSTDAGTAPETCSAAPVDVEDVAVAPLDVRVVDRTTVEHEQADLSTARRIVAVGRGVKSEDDLAMIENLAAALGAEVACSRPLAEGLDWFAKDRYVGVSGQHVSPELYLAVGISGQLQHMVGAHDAGTIVAINSDKDAPIFGQCDYGVVGDLYKIVPALTEKVNSHV